MAELKTKQTEASVAAYLSSIDDPQRREDCAVIARIMGRVTGHEPKMWGSSIVGFGSYHYKYASGHEGDSCLVGFSSRKAEISVYIAAGFDSREKLLRELGKHKVGKACLYIKRLSDVEVPVLEKLIRASFEDSLRRPRKSSSS